jgi:hypothetical protein
VRVTSNPSSSEERAELWREEVDFEMPRVQLEIQMWVLGRLLD